MQLARPALWITALSFTGSAQAESPAQQGLKIAMATDEANEGFQSESSTLEMELINAHGDAIKRRMQTRIMEGTDDGDKSVITFHWPADVKGTRMLTWTHKKGDDDQWLYLPAIKRVKRISSRNKTGSFMGSEFSYEDLAGQEVEKYTYTFLEEISEGGRKLWKIERYPVDKRSGYSKQVVWIDQGYMNTKKVDYYDRKGELLKTAEFSGYQRFGKLWRPGKIAMFNHQTKKRSVLTWQERKLQVEMDEEDFDSANLED